MTADENAKAIVACLLRSFLSDDMVGKMAAMTQMQQLVANLTSNEWVAICDWAGVQVEVIVDTTATES